MDQDLKHAIFTDDVRQMESCLHRQPSLLYQRTGKYARTLLFSVATWGRVVATRFLIQKGADVNTSDINGNTPLIAVLGGGLNIDAIAKILIESGADVNAHTKDGYTPLHFACMDRHYRVVCALLEHGANPNAVNKHRATPLWFACCHGLTLTVSTLLQFNADRNIATVDGSTPLQIAREKGHPDLAELITQFRHW